MWLAWSEEYYLWKGNVDFIKKLSASYFEVGRTHFFVFRWLGIRYLIFWGWVKLTPIRMIVHWIHPQNYSQLRYVSSSVSSYSEWFQSCLGLGGDGNCASDFVNGVGIFLWNIALIQYKKLANAHWILCFSVSVSWAVCSFPFIPVHDFLFS